MTRNIKKTKIFFVSLTAVGTFSLINAFCSFIGAFIDPIYYSYVYIINIVAEVILTLIVIIFSFNKNFSEIFLHILSLSRNIKVIMTLFIWEILILVTTLTILLNQNSNTPLLALSCFLILITMIISCTILYLLIINNLKSTYYKSINTTIQNNLQGQAKHYERLSKTNENLRKFQHDYNNLKIGLNSYLKNNDIDGALLFLEECDKIIETDDITYHTGHPIVDALFSNKSNILKRNHIAVTFDGLIPYDMFNPVDLCIIFGNISGVDKNGEALTFTGAMGIFVADGYIYISDYHLVTILGNILDNAIESCLKFDCNSTKEINISIKQNKDYIFITFTNPILNNIEIKNNNVLTSKENAESHGIGLLSIKKVIKKYHGHLYLKCENNIFTTEIDFCTSSN